jgi:monooxygenase
MPFEDPTSPEAELFATNLLAIHRYQWRKIQQRYAQSRKDAIADGKDILQYLKDTAAEYGVDKHIRYRRKATAYSWSSEENLWTVTVENGETGTTETLTADFLVSTTGYYNYEAGYTPEFPGADDFKGQIVHPQHWPEDLDYTGKNVVVIGSGATSITLIPSMAPDAGHITMLQRTPTYIISQPKIDPVAKVLKRTLPANLAAKAIHARYASVTIGFFEFARRQPKATKALIKRWAKIHLPKDFDYDKHLVPPYNPWDQRMCVVPGADLFKAIHSHKVDIVTEHIEKFDETGILLKNGQHLDADIIVTATGLDVQLFGGATVEVDGEKVDPGKKFTYKALMLDDIPNFAFIIGYSNASWTLKADLVCEYIVRLLDHMDENSYTKVVPHIDGELLPEDIMKLSSGYLQRAADRMPKAGNRDPWRLKQNWYFDKKFIQKSPLVDDEIHFS